MSYRGYDRSPAEESVRYNTPRAGKRFGQML